MDETHVFPQIMHLLYGAFDWASKNPKTAGAISLFSISTDLWAIAALQALKGGKGMIVEHAGDAYDRGLSFVIRFMVLVASLTIFCEGAVFLAEYIPAHSYVVSASITLPLAIAGWYFLPRFGRWGEVHALSCIHGKMSRGRGRDFISGLIRSDPTRQGFLIEFFYLKVLVLDSLICSSILLRMVRASLVWLRIPT